MKQIGTRFFILYPELGSVLVGDENFAVNINNHVGNEETRVAIVDFGKIDTSHMYLETTINCRNAHIFVSDTADAKSRSREEKLSKERNFFIMKRIYGNEKNTSYSYRKSVSDL